MMTRIEDLIGRALLSAIFLFFAVIGLHQVGGLLANPWASDTWLLDLVARVASLAFAVLVTGATIVRLPAKQTAAGWEPRVTAILGTFLMLSLIVLPRAEIGAGAKLVATIIIVVGTTLSIYCLMWLGRSFSVMAHARRLVVAGPYAVVRHPLYAAEMITMVGVTMKNLSWPALAIFALNVALQFRRMHNEERVLRAAFPEYGDYAQRVPMFLPWTGRAPKVGPPSRPG